MFFAVWSTKVVVNLHRKVNEYEWYHHCIFDRGIVNLRYKVDGKSSFAVRSTKALVNLRHTVGEA